MIQFDHFFNFYLNKFPFIKPNDIMRLLPHIHYISVKKNHLIIQDGTSNTNLYWVQKGLVRLFHKKDGTDVTFNFTKEGAYIASIDSLLYETPATYSAETLIDTQLYYINYIEFQKLKDSNVNLLKLEIEILKHIIFHCIHQDIYKTMPKSAEEHYLQLFNDHKYYISQIPAKYIASYLGITEVSLSRIKKRLLHKKV